MSRIAILTPSLVRGDAVGNDAVQMHHLLRKAGHATRLFASYADCDEVPVSGMQHAAKFLRHPDARMIYHHSVGWREGLELVERRLCPTAVRYHNVTPPQFFENSLPEYVAACKTGRAQTGVLARMGLEGYMADSAFNARELLDEGAPAERCTVVPPFHHIDRLLATPADMAALDAYRTEGVTWLMVGRVAPNKGHVALIEAFSIYHHHYNPDSRLLIVGKRDGNVVEYNTRIEQMIAAYRLENAVRLTGMATEGQLKAAFLVADVFATASRHEGFCVPLVEAMAMKIPIVAYGNTAIPETVGDAGIVWDENDPWLMAATVDRLVTDRRLAGRLGRAGAMRYRSEFSTAAIAERFEAALKPVLQSQVAEAAFRLRLIA